MKIPVEYDQTPEFSPADRDFISQKISVLQELILENDLENRLPESEKRNKDRLIIRVVICSDATIREINQRFREIDSPTDVITFPFPMTKSEDEFDALPEAEIYISADTAARQATEQGHSLAEEIIVLAVHGVCHAFGFDHELSEPEAREMKTMESFLLNGLELAYLSPLTQ